jgi:hypothetical protein
MKKHSFPRHEKGTLARQPVMTWRFRQRFAVIQPPDGASSRQIVAGAISAAFCRRAALDDLKHPTVMFGVDSLDVPAFYLFFYAVLRRRPLGPPPFSAMWSTPAVAAAYPGQPPRTRCTQN